MERKNFRVSLTWRISSSSAWRKALARARYTRIHRCLCDTADHSRRALVYGRVGSSDCMQLIRMDPILKKERTQFFVVPFKARRADLPTLPPPCTLSSVSHTPSLW